MADVQVTTYVFEYKIQNFSHSSPPADTPLILPIFTAGKYCEEQWKIKLALEGIHQNKIDCMAIYFSLATNQSIYKTSPMTVSCEVSMVNPDNGSKMWKILLDRETIDKSLDNMLPVITKLMPKRKEIYLINDTLTIRCELNLSVKGSNAKNFVIEECRLASHLKKFLNATTHSDVTIIAESLKFPAHKVILAARSSVFSAMFSNESMVENQKNEVEIKDLVPKVVENMLYYIYTDEMGDESSPLDLLFAAEKYQLDGLKLMCEQMLMKDLDENNATDILVHADLCNSQTLKTYVIDYIISHETQVGRSSAFKDFIREYPALVAEIYESHIDKVIKQEDSEKQ